MAAHDVQDVQVECRKSFSREDAKAAKKRRQEFGGGLDGASCKPMLETNRATREEEVSNTAIDFTAFATGL